MRINLRYGVAAGIAAAAFTAPGPATAQASETPGAVIPAAASHFPGSGLPGSGLPGSGLPGIGLGQDKLGLPAHQGTALRSTHGCDRDDRWCRGDDDFGGGFHHFHHYGDGDDFHHFHHHGDDDR